jgi:NodT family efflux transporter outer membrane factor (OMF) lipoprotein
VTHTGRARGWHVRLGVATLLTATVGSACAPKTYERPQVVVVPGYKENAAWKQADPQDAVLRGNWWELFGDAELNDLEGRMAIENQTLKAADAQFAQARAALRGVRASGSPQVAALPSISGAQPSGNRAVSSFHESYADFLAPIDVSYEADVWGRIRNSVNAGIGTAQATAADVQTISLSLHAELAADYLTLRGLDRTRDLLDSTVRAYERALELTTNRFRGGLASQADVALAETLLEQTRAQAVDIEVFRAALEHAVAVLVGSPAGSFSVDRVPVDLVPPVVPVGVPSELLERRPDIAASERRVAAANAQVGAATSALYPVLTLTGAAGFESSSFGSWLAAASHFWSIVPVAAVNVFDAGRRRATVEQASAVYDQATALYRADVLSAFREVEDQLAALRVLEDEAAVQDRAVASSQRALDLATTRYRGGIASYLEVTSAQSALLTNQRVALSVQIRRMTATVLLMKALGGGWNASSLPQAADLGR